MGSADEVNITVSELNRTMRVRIAPLIPPDNQKAAVSFAESKVFGLQGGLAISNQKATVYYREANP